MASNLACIGIRIEDTSDLQWLITEVMKATRPTEKAEGRLEYQWQDRSGSRLSFAVQNGDFDDFIPSFAGKTSLDLGTVVEVSNGIFVVDVVDSSGETLTRVAVDPVDVSAFRARAESGLPAGAARLTAFGVQVAIHENAEAFLSSDASLLVPRRSIEDEVPARFAAESFFSFGSFDVDESDATAALNGTVISAERRTVALTGESFIAARVRASVFEVDLCFPSDPHVPVPTPGNIIGGMVYLVATLRDDRGFEREPRLRLRFPAGLARAANWACGR
jgi:hypothetical protein